MAKTEPHLANGGHPTAPPEHLDFKVTEASRPEWDFDRQYKIYQTKDPSWTWGSGASDGGACLEKDHVAIDPADPDRAMQDNYKLLISGIVPRPIGFISTRSADGSSNNLAPMSYTQVVNSDPPVFCIGFAGGLDRMKDTLRNIVDTGEGVLNMISEHFLEASNACTLDAPYGVSEWALSGLTQASCNEVRASRVKESIFSVEFKLLETREFESKKTPGKKSGAMVLVEGVQFWVREDAINEEHNVVDPAVLKPISRLGGISYARVTDGIELIRPALGRDLSEEEMMAINAQN